MKMFKINCKLLDYLTEAVLRSKSRYTRAELDGKNDRGREENEL